MKEPRPQDLRIGNWMLCYGKHRRIVEIGLYGILATSEDGQSACKFGNPALEYIPLTPEWLERLGGSKRVDNGVYGYKYNIHHDTDSMFVIERDWRNEPSHFFGIEYTDSPDERDNGIVYNFAYEVKWVHQLQNLIFALTGTELTFKIKHL